MINFPVKERGTSSASTSQRSSSHRGTSKKRAKKELIFVTEMKLPGFMDKLYTNRWFFMGKTPVRQGRGLPQN